LLAQLEPGETYQQVLRSVIMRTHPRRGTGQEKRQFTRPDRPGNRLPADGLAQVG